MRFNRILSRQFFDDWPTRDVDVATILEGNRWRQPEEYCGFCGSASAIRAILIFGDQPWFYNLTLPRQHGAEITFASLSRFLASFPVCPRYPESCLIPNLLTRMSFHPSSLANQTVHEFKEFYRTFYSPDTRLVFITVTMIEILGLAG